MPTTQANTARIEKAHPDVLNILLQILDDPLQITAPQMQEQKEHGQQCSHDLVRGIVHVKCTHIDDQTECRHVPAHGIDQPWEAAFPQLYGGQRDPRGRDHGKKQICAVQTACDRSLDPDQQEETSMPQQHQWQPVAFLPQQPGNAIKQQKKNADIFLMRPAVIGKCQDNVDPDPSHHMDQKHRSLQQNMQSAVHGGPSFLYVMPGSPTEERRLPPPVRVRR